jgi:probable HAF family extracellular repeat protein
MKFRSYFAASAVALVATAMLSVQVSAQRTRYKLVDLGTFGGPNSFINGDIPPMINNRGLVVGEAESSTPCPYAGGFVSDGVLAPAFIWQDGVLTNLGLLRGGCFTLPNSVNSKGMMVGSGDIGVIDNATGLPVIHADLRYKGQVLDLGTFGGSNSLANDVNDSGVAVGGAENADPDPWNLIFTIITGLPSSTAWHAALWQAGSKLDLGTLGGPDSLAGVINQNGLVAGFSFTNSIANATTGAPTIEPFVWQRGSGMVDLGTLGGTVGFAAAVNNMGQVTGLSDLAGDTSNHAFVWQNGVLTDLGTLGGENSDTGWINNSGQIIGRSDLPDGTHHAVIWQNGTMIDLGTVGGDPCSNGHFINEKGQAVGSSTDCHGTILHTFLWENGNMIDLSSHVLPGSGVVAVDPIAINDAGEIVGNGTLLTGENHVVVLKPCASDCSPELASGPSNGSKPGRSIGNSKTALEERSKSPLDRIRAQFGERYRVLGSGKSTQ